jgi:hypothetical protein
MALIAYALFFLAGIGFGYAADGRWRWFPLVLPTLLALATALGQGIDGTLLIRFALALLITAAGVLLGQWLAPDEPPRRAEPGWR